MDVQVLSENSLKIKIKKTSLIINPSASMPKTDADAIISFEKNTNTTKVTEYRLIINGTGEYEIGGVKISAADISGGLMFTFGLDNFEMALVKASSLANISLDKVKNVDAVIINADLDINQSVLTAMETRIVVLYGQQVKEAAAKLGKSGPASSKVSFSEEKLPEESEIYLLS